ncbi:class I SAM-dependent methyltransferase [Pedobacter agri]|uniref:class I SAM-dependent methyltransferase n=1 Tax=Pedobacter agri TaxID=454586 RepID=UPI00292FC75C|nr:class I SAM-dependent methyltransferase [Pedobacter agri]
MINNYDKIAQHYDFLSRLVFGTSQVSAQINQLKYISSNSSILIVGGGTGWILEELAKLHQTGLKITFVEISAKMISLSKARNYGNNEVEFINLGIEEYEINNHFDIIITPFLFDNFSRERCHKVFHKLHLSLNNSGLWFMVDFTTQTKGGNWWKKPFLTLMYTFFNLMARVEAKKLVDMNPYFEKGGYQIIEERFYYAHFIKAVVYKK